MISGLRQLRDPRLQSLLVLVVLVLGAIALIGDTLLTWRADAQATALYQDRTELLEQRLAATANPQAEALGKAAADARILIDAQTSGLVSAEFQRLLSSRAQSVGAVVRTVDVPEEELIDTGSAPVPNGVERIRLTADIEVMEQSLPDLLHAIEAGTPVMVIDAFTLRLNRKIDMVSAGASGADQPLSLSVTLSAFRAKGVQS